MSTTTSIGFVLLAAAVGLVLFSIASVVVQARRRERRQPLRTAS